MSLARHARVAIGALSAVAIAGAVGLVASTAAAAAATGGRGATLPYVELQAENAGTNGTVVGPTSTGVTYGTLAAEASYRKAVTLSGQGKYVQFTTTAPTNSIVLRYSIPDSSNGSVYTAPLSLYVNGTKQPNLTTTNAYSWYYGGYPFTNTPGSNPHHFYDEVHRLFSTTYPAGTTFKVQVDAEDTASSYTIDFADFEQVGDQLAPPAGAVSVTSKGADATGASDSTAAFNAAISAAGSGGTVWIPAGTFKVPGHIAVDDVTIKGAGMWYSTVTGAAPGFYGSSAPNPSTNVHLSDFAISGDVQERDDNAQVNGVGGAMSSSTVSNLWIEHLKVGAWMDGPMDGLTFSGMRIRDTTADGINFHGGVTNSTVTNSDLRNLGDDGLAMWADSALGADADDTFSNNTVQYPILANGIAIYGGHDNSVTGNRVVDAGLTQGGGIHVGQRFTSTPVGKTTISNNTLIRDGSLDPNWQFGVGALWFDGSQGAITGPINVSNALIQQSPYEAIQWVEGTVSGVNLSNITVQGTGTYVLQEQTGGSASIANLTATGVGASSPVYSCEGGNFVVTDGGGNSGISGTPACGAFATPVWPPYVPENDVTVTPSSLSFGSQATGTTSAARTVTVANNGTAAQTVAVAVSGPFAQTSTCGSSLAAGASCSVGVTFSPTAAGAASGTLTVTVGGSATPVALTGTGVAPGPVLSADPQSLAFASTVVGATTTAQNVTITNTGTSTATVSGVTTSGDFAKSGTCTTIAAGSSCSLGVTFTPTAAGTRSGTLTVTSNANGSPTTVALSGSGVGSTTNVAAGRAATASSQVNSAQPASAVTDGDTSTYWESANHAFPQWVQVDLGQTYAVGKVVVHLPPATAWATRTQTFAVQGSTDGSSFGTLVGSAAYTFDPATGNVVTITVPSGSARYVRLNVTANSGWPAGQASELEVYPGGGNPPQTATLSLSPTSLTFPSTAVGSPSAAQTVTVSNTGTAAATVSGITTSGDFAQTSTCGSSIAAGGSCTVAVTFTPTAAGARTGSLAIASNASNGTVTASLSGTGAGTSSTNLALHRATSESSHTQTYASANVTDGAATTYWESSNNAFPQWVQTDLGSAQSVGKVVLKLPPATAWATRTQTLQVQGSTDGSSFATLKASATYTFDPASGNTVTITFTAATERYVRVTFTANSGQPAGQLSELEVYGSGGNPGPATLAASPTSVSFGSTGVGSTSAAQTVTVTNTGGSTANLSGVGVAGDFADTTTCGATLAAGASCTASVTFRPTAAGARTGTLTVASDASNPSLAVALSGTGTAASSATLAANPTSVSFGTIGTGSSSSPLTVTLSNTGTASASIGGVTVSGDFTQTTTCGSTLAAGSSCMVAVVFRPTAAGTRTGTLTVASNASNPTLAVPLSGTGASTGTATLTASPSNLAFASTSVGSSAPAQSVTISNTGTAAAAISRVSVSGDYSEATTCGSSLAAGATCTVAVTFAPTAAGTRTGTLTVASNATNPSLTVALSGTGASTTSTDQAAGKPMTSSSDTFTFVAANANDGNLATYWEGAVPSWLNVAMGTNVNVTSVVVKLNPDPAWGTRTQTFSIEGRDQAGGAYTTIKASATYTFTQGTNVVTIPVSATAADVRLSFTANSGAPGGQVAELQVLGTKAPNPDLTVSTVTTSPASPVETDAVTMSATVRNIGTASSAATTVSLYLGTTKVGAANVPAIAAGGQTTVSASVGTQTAGTYATSAVVDEGNAVVELNEGNNSGTGAALTVAPVQSADLVASTTWSPGTPSGGQTVTFSTVVRNQGNQPSSSGSHAVTVVVKDQSGATVKTLTPTAPSGTIAAGASVTVQAGTWTAADGKYTVTTTVAADSAELAVKRANNTATAAFAVGRGASMPYDAYEAEDGTVSGGTVVGPNRTIGDLAGEASGRKAVHLTASGQSVSWTTRAATNTIDVRFSIPDGTTTTLGVFNGSTQVGTVNLVSKYAWLYGAETSPQNSGTGPRHIYDEAGAVLTSTVPAGSTLSVRDTTGADIAVDFVQLELATPVANPDPTHLVTVSGSDQNAIQTAINTANGSSTYTGVYIPAGDYAVSGKFNLGTKALQIVGAGPWFTRLVAPQGQENTDVGFTPTGAAATGSQFRSFAIVGNYTNRQDGSGQAFPLTNVSNIVIDNVWVTHMVVMVWGQNVDSSTFSNDRIDDTFADGITLANDSQGNTITNSVARATGDDGFALFNAQDVHAGTVANNLEQNLTATLTWRASGFAVYGGSGNTFRNLYAADQLTYPGLTVSSINFGISFVGFSGTTTIDNVSIVRSGGHFWGQQVFPALWLYSGDGAFTGIRISNVDISDPTYDGIMMQTKYLSASQPTNPIADTTLTNVTVDKANEPRADKSNVDATATFSLTGRVGNAVWCNPAPESGQGPAIGAVTFTGLTMTNNSHDIVNTCPGFTITRS